MTEKIQINKKDAIDFQALVMGRTFLGAISRYGKSWTVRRICEQVFGRAGLIILDVEGEYSSLRERFPFLIVGKDIPISQETAPLVAEQVLKNDLSVIIDLSDPELDIVKSQEFVAKFISRFIALETTQRKPYLFIIEEADELAPERGVYKSLSLPSIIKLCKKGGKRGLGTVLVTQRPAFVSKMCVSQCTNKVIGRIEWQSDLNVIQEFLRVSDEEIERVKKLEVGEFLFAGDFIDEPTFIKVGGVSTTDLSETPDITPPKPPKQLDAVIAMLSKATAEPKEEKDLGVRREVGLKTERLDRELSKERGLSKALEREIDEKNKLLSEYEARLAEKEEQAKEYEALKKKLAEIFSKLGGKFIKEIKKTNETYTDAALTSPSFSVSKAYDIWLNKFSGGKKRMLETVIQHRRMTKRQLALLVDMSYKSGTFSTYLGVLRRAGLVEFDHKEVWLVV